MDKTVTHWLSSLIRVLEMDWESVDAIIDITLPGVPRVDGVVDFEVRIDRKHVTFVPLRNDHDVQHAVEFHIGNQTLSAQRPRIQSRLLLNLLRNHAADSKCIKRGVTSSELLDI